MDAATITAHPDRKDAAYIAFDQRYRAESFLGAAAADIPHVGKCELSWAPNSVVAIDTSSKDEAMADATLDSAGSRQAQRGDPDYDVADDDARWLAD